MQPGNTYRCIKMLQSLTQGFKVVCLYNVYKCAIEKLIKKLENKINVLTVL